MIKFDRFVYMLAPLEDTSDDALRTLCHNHGADYTFTEMARVDSLARKNQSTWEKIVIRNETPAFIQIVGSNEQTLKRFLSMYEPEHGFLGFNFNVGCPAPQIVGHGLGCAMVKRIAKTKRLVEIVKERGFTCSLKMRLGLNDFEKQRKVYLNLIDAVPADFFVVHARTGNQTYEDKADWKVYEECAKKGKVIIANGDIKTAEDVEEVKKYGVKGVMIGRNAVYDPAIFNRIKGLPTPSIEELKKEYEELVKKYPSPFKYQKNVLKRIGKNQATDLTKKELDAETMG